ncbi:MAG TPA: HAMP domain-containing sensor histidine kinase [Beijerinckiaceae bacterium]|jgi:signal transduction histidine kinase
MRERTSEAGRLGVKERTSGGGASTMRRLPVSARIVLLSVLNTLAILFVGLSVMQGAGAFKTSWRDLLEARNADRLLTRIEAEASGLQSQIHRYFTQPDPHLQLQIELRRKTLAELLENVGLAAPEAAGSASSLSVIKDRLIASFEDLRRARVRLSSVYETEFLRLAKEIDGLYGVLESAVRPDDTLMRPALAKSRAAFTAAVLSGNAFYLSQSQNAAQEAFANVAMIQQTLPILRELTPDDLQRRTLVALEEKLVAFRDAINRLSEAFEGQSALLREGVDETQAQMTARIADLARRIREREARVESALDQSLITIYVALALIAAASLAIVAVFGAAITRSISRPLKDLMSATESIVRGRLAQPVPGVEAPDELGAMARSIEVFRHNAISKMKAEQELLLAKERAERTLLELRDTQASLIEAEKMAALGGLVAGVAHEVNNPVGIGLTVSSALAQRALDFERQVNEGSLRRSQLTSFSGATAEAARLIQSNLERAAELIRSFKQVAVDRSHSERRVFDVKEAIEQIMASLSPGLKHGVQLRLTCPYGLTMDSYPGALGQVLTNLFLNAMNHAYRRKQTGVISVSVARIGDRAAFDFVDDGDGMPEAVASRAFEPFFTTRRGDGGTGLGLHIVYNIVTAALGGSISVESTVGAGSRFRISLPLTAPAAAPTPPAAQEIPR